MSPGIPAPAPMTWGILQLLRLVMQAAVLTDSRATWMVALYVALRSHVVGRNRQTALTLMMEGRVRVGREMN